MTFIQFSSETERSLPAEVGPALWPVAMPAWMMLPGTSAKPGRLDRKIILGAVLCGHLAIAAFFMARQLELSPDSVTEQARLTVISLQKTLQAETQSAVPQEIPEPAAAASKPVTPDATAVEWSRTTLWQPKGGEAAEEGNGGGKSPSNGLSLLAGLGATGPARAAQGVNDPYAGAAPVWNRPPVDVNSPDHLKGSILLLNAPNPAVLEEIRRYIMLQFRLNRGYATITVSVDRWGAVSRIEEIDTDLPGNASEKLQESLIGRVIARKSDRLTSTMKLPKISFVEI